jgi:RNA polymerase sigma-70 factor (ECF subfamily)
VLIERARKNLRHEYQVAKAEKWVELLEETVFMHNQPTDEAGQQTYAELAAQLGVKEGTIKSRVSRMRTRFGELLRQEIAQTVMNKSQVNEEIRELIAAVSKRG